MTQSTITLRLVGERLTGEVIVQASGTTDKYILQGKTNGQQAAGTATYPADGTVFQFEAALQQDQLLFGIGRNGTALLAGTLAQTTGNADGSVAGKSPAERATPNSYTPTPKADGLYRDPVLIGTWRTTTNYGGGVTDGGFYGSTTSTIILYADGRFGDGPSSGYASGSGVSVQSSGGSSGTASGKLAAAGARWFTKGNIVYMRLRVNGQLQDLPASKYFVENGRMLITDLKTGQKTLYVKQ